MTTTIKDLMKSGGLRECKIIAGHSGIETEVKYVTIMEVPDILNWLKGGELLLTSLYPIRDSVDKQKELIKQLASIGTAAVAIKPYRFVDDIQVILVEAEKYGMPIIEIPKHISYLDILWPAVNEIFESKVILQEDYEQAEQLLQEISIEEYGLSYFIDSLSGLTRNPITVESQLPYIETPAPPKDIESLLPQQKDELALMKRSLRMTRVMNKEEIECIVAPIIVDKECLGFITCWGVNEVHLKVDFALMNKASTLLSIEFLKQKVKHDVKKQYVNNFLVELLTQEGHNEKFVEKYAAEFAFSADSLYVVVYIAAADEQNGQQLDELLAATHQYYTGCIVGEVSRQSILLLPVQHSNFAGLRADILELYHHLEQNPQLMDMVSHIGVGSCAKGIKELQNSYVEAKLACDLGPKVRHKKKEDRKLTFYDELGIFKVIHSLSNEEIMRGYYEETIEPILAFDQQRQTNFFETVIAYFEENEHLQRTAERMNVHVNTLKYRLTKIEKLTGLNLKTSEGKQMLYLGLNIYYLLHAA
ncbi:PucR family transcriptional regulator ligand-binding domain-containing protein [Alkalihalobacillus oceani]|uniref:PucR family transcriptional regulator n=1 Tax=Halalkalibacter oceani TaxID=1653776 RepID=UPI00203B0B74|nr:PucR family transcriptional regulator [Halalkalibacter oceani]MCM3760940.1 PucR family transcriptional regulator ligand-binding domain-containing protein [Halalkalibacter oceani]